MEKWEYYSQLNGKMGVLFPTEWKKMGVLFPTEWKMGVLFPTEWKNENLV